MSAARMYERRGRALDEHINTCPACASGNACQDGDQVADAEFRAWRDLQRDDPTTAANHPARKGFTW